MTSFKRAWHETTGRSIVEVYDNDGRFVAAIYPSEEYNGINIVSAHIDHTFIDDTKPLPALIVSFKRAQ